MKPNKTTTKRSFFLFTVILLLGCSNEIDELFPYTAINFNINLSNNSTLYSPNTSEIFKRSERLGAGYGGIIIYCNGDNDYSAFEAVCTYEQDRNILADSLVNDRAYCRKCKSGYFLRLNRDAPPIEGSKSQYALKQYNCYQNGNILTVTN
ncbi:MAG: hypothetical protein ACK5MG_05255 [Bacteroidales bacterium]